MQNYIRTQIEHCKGNPRSTWKVIKSYIPTNPDYQKDHIRIAEEFNACFTSVGRLTADKVKELDVTPNEAPSPRARQNRLPISERFRLQRISILFTTYLGLFFIDSRR